jgi:hypothetical protein
VSLAQGGEGLEAMWGEENLVSAFTKPDFGLLKQINWRMIFKITGMWSENEF